MTARFKTVEEYRETFSGASEETVNQDAAIPEGDYYVTVRDAGRVGFLLGPFQDYRDALTNVRRGRDLACEAKPDAWFYAYGTSRLPIGTTCKPIFGA